MVYLKGCLMVPCMPVSLQSHRRFPLTRLLGNSGNLRILRALLEYEAPQSSTQLVRATGMTLPGVLKILDNLVAQGAVEVHGSGRSRVFSAIKSAQIEDLKVAFMHERTEWERFLGVLRTTFAKRRDVLAAWLYGSVARGDDGPDSDVDLAILVKDESAADRVRDSLHELERSLRAHFSIMALTPKDLQRVEPTLWAAIVRDGRTLKGPEAVRIRKPRSEKT
jgi:predicted nucleotidyltransferase